MNLKKFKGVKTVITPPEIKNPDYIDSLLALETEKPKRNILPILGTIAAAIIMVAGVTLWALIGSGIRGQKPTEQPTVIKPADDSSKTEDEPKNDDSDDKTPHLEKPYDTGYDPSDLHLAVSDIFIGKVQEIEEIDEAMLASLFLDKSDNAKLYTVSVEQTFRCNYAKVTQWIRFVYAPGDGQEELQLRKKYLLDGSLQQYDSKPIILSADAFCAKVDGDELTPLCELSRKTLGDCLTLRDFEQNIIPQIPEQTVRSQWMFTRTGMPEPEKISAFFSTPRSGNENQVIYTLARALDLRDKMTIARPIKYVTGAEGEKAMPKSLEAAIKDSQEVFSGTIITKEFVGDVTLPDTTDVCKNAYLYTINIQDVYASFLTVENMTAYLLQSSDFAELDVGNTYLVEGRFQYYNKKYIIYSDKLLEVKVNEDGVLIPLNDIAQKLFLNIPTVDKLEQNKSFKDGVEAINRNKPHLSVYNDYLKEYYGEIKFTDSDERIATITKDIQKALDVDYDYTPGKDLE